MTPKLENRNSKTGQQVIPAKGGIHNLVNPCLHGG
jgi:hypothetical protein